MATYSQKSDDANRPHHTPSSTPTDLNRSPFARSSTTRGGASIRLSLDVSPELYEALTILADKLHTTKSDVLRKSIALMEVAVDAKQRQKKLGIAGAGQVLETEIIGI